MKHIFLGKAPIKTNFKLPTALGEKAPIYETSYFRRAKRVHDLAIAILSMLFVCTWLFPIVAVLIKLSSKGPIFFKQLRHGENSVPFYCYKFRTMVVNEEADFLQAKKGDSRVTRIGAFLRGSSLDELPQLINVLKGEMSIVGPRPHAIPMNEIFAKEIPGYMNRHTMKPGITGLAQSKGFRGEIINFHDLSSRYKLDMFYLRKCCFYFDFKIILWTAYSLIFKDNKAY